MRSTFSRFILTVSAIILISFSMLASIVSVSINDYATNEKKKELSLSAEIVSSLISSEFKRTASPDFSVFTTQNASLPSQILSAVSENTENTSFFVTNENGNVLLFLLKHDSLQGILTFPVSICTTVAEQGEYFETGSLNGALPATYTIYAVPIRGIQNRNVGTVFAISTNESATALVRSTGSSIVLANLWIMLAIMIAVYFITQRMLAPMREMSRAAKEFAKGNFKTRIRVTGQDEIAELETAFNNMAQSLSKSEEQRSTFLANVSHDLRTPMTTIAGYIDGILDGAIPYENQAHYLSIVSSEIHRLSRLVSQLLDISRLEANMRPMRPSDFDICEIARLSLISLEQKIEEKKLDVSFEPDSEEMKVRADQDAIHQIIYNLCENAVKFSKEGGLLRLTIKAGEKNKYLVSIYNEGNGISKDDLPYIFDRFYKTDKSRGLDKVGVGLGLYIVKTMLTASGESISVTSEEGKDCCFTFTVTQAE